MNRINLANIDLNLLVTFEALMDLGSVTLAADRVGRTPSAVSHALQRLRDQLGDPLMVKVGGRMQPSPFALTLIEEIRPILRGIEKVIAPPDRFDPATSTKTFRIAMPSFPSIVARMSDRVAQAAPGVTLEWQPYGPQTVQDVLAERVHVALAAPGTALSDGIDGWLSPEMRRITFARGDHPAVKDWGKHAWLQWPHVVVGMGGAARQTVQQAVERDGLQRRIGATLPDFSGAAPLLARSDHLGTFAPIGLAEDAVTYGLAFLEPPIQMDPIRFPILWNARLANDPAIFWLRGHLIAAYQHTAKKIDAIIAAAKVVKLRP